MPGDLKPIGGGVDIVNLEGLPGPIAQTQQDLGLIDLGNRIKLQNLDAQTKQLGLQDLTNKLQQAPYDMAIKQQTVLENQNKIANFAVDNELKRAQLISSQGDERRKQAEFVMNGLKSIPELANASPELARVAFQKYVPGGEFLPNKDGTFTAIMPSADGRIATIPLDPRNVASPEKKVEYEERFRKEYTNNLGGFQTVDEFYRNMTNLLPQASGAGDVGVIFAYMKMLDRNSKVTENQVATAEQAPGIAPQILRLYNKAVTTKAPVLGDANSDTRQMFKEAADRIYDNARQTAVQQAEAYYHIAKQSHLDPANVVIPIGGISSKLFEPKANPTTTTSQVVAPVVNQVAGRTTNGTPSAVPPGLPNSTPVQPQQDPGKKLDDLLTNSIFGR